ncbi:MAG TPA: TIGR02147 family protein [Fibrobacteraceae bacterium]|nr:TIGR02147 family protein [Fibrobacteraceae bacterium]
MSTASHSIDLYEYLDYQAFLSDYYTNEKAKGPLFSYRVFAAGLGMDASLLVKILQGKRHLSLAGIKAVVRYFAFSKEQRDYFQALVAYNKADSDSEVRTRFEQLLSLRPAASRKIDADEFRYFQHWYYPAIRAALDFVNFHTEDNPSRFATRFSPRLTAAQVEEALGVLLRLGLVQQIDDGQLVPSEAHLSTGERWRSAAVAEYQRQSIDLGIAALETIPREERDISTLTLSLNSTQLQTIREIMAEARRSIIRLIDTMPSSQCDAVYQLNVQLFPVLRRENV